MVCFAKEKSDQPEDGPWKGRKSRLEKLSKNIFVIKTLNKLCLPIFYLYIWWTFGFHKKSAENLTLPMVPSSHFKKDYAPQS